MLSLFNQLIQKKIYGYSLLYYLRKNKFFVKFLLPLLDIPISVPLYKVKWKVNLRLIKDLSWYLNCRKRNSALASLFLAINKTFQTKYFWDVGANIGFFSWLLMSYSNNITIVLFEPDLENINLLEKTISQAKLSNIELVRSAVSDKVGEASFAVDKITGATGTLESEQTFIQQYYNANPSLIIVKTVTLDYVWKQLEMLPPELIKIDVEGADKKVFDGAIELIEQCQPIIVFECSSSTKIELVSRLESLGYVSFNADHINGSIENAYNLLAIPSRYIHLKDEFIENWRNQIEVW